MLFVTFSTFRYWILPPEAREIALRHCVHDNGRKMELYCAVVMPDHVHLLYRLLTDANGNLYGLTEIVGTIKSVSAHVIAKALGRTEHVWLRESYDHVLRRNEGPAETADYICHNPVRKGLCRSCDEYPYLWRSWVDDEKNAGEGACGTL